jgi:RimJ/RimL family protein N-acetyltransferase
MIPLSEFRIVQPKTPDEVDALIDDIREMVFLIPEASEWGEAFLETIQEYPRYVTLVYHDGQPVGFILITDSEGYDLGKDTLEFWGSVIPEYRQQGLTLSISPMVIRQAFKRTGKRKMLAKIDPENKDAQMAITRLGFERIEPHPDLPPPDKLIYKLTRKAALNNVMEN